MRPLEPQPLKQNAAPRKPMRFHCSFCCGTGLRSDGNRCLVCAGTGRAPEAPETIEPIQGPRQ